MNAFRLVAVLFLAGAPARAQLSGTTYYEILPGSTTTWSCPTGCSPCSAGTGPLEGKFALTYTHTDPAGFEHYAVSSFLWNGQVTTFFIGSGVYTRGGPGTPMQQMSLNLLQGAITPINYDSGLVPTTVTFPDVDISVSGIIYGCIHDDRHMIATPGVSGTVYCSGTDYAGACPCFNVGATGNGCASASHPLGAHLSASGSAGLAADSVVLTATGVPNTSVMFLQNDLGGGGGHFGDGIRCLSNPIRRLRTVQASGGIAVFPGPTDPALSVVGGVLLSGVDRAYQAWYRTANTLCNNGPFNLTNGFSFHWWP